MPLAARPRSSRLVVLAAAALSFPLLVGVPAAAEEPTGPDGSAAPGDVVVGELVQAWAEYADHEDAAEHQDEALLSWVTEDDGTSVRVDSADVEDVPVGATVEVTLGDEVPAEPGTPQPAEPVHEVVEAEVVAPAEPAPVAPASAPYTNEVTVVLVEPAGLTRDATTVEQLVNLVNGPVADFWESQSNGAVRISASAGSPTWVTSTAVCDSSGVLLTDVAGQLGWTGGAGKHLLLYVPGYPTGMPSCAYGLAELKSSPGAGGMLYVRDLETSVIAHELGHNFGLGHSSAVQCDASAEAAPCQRTEYWDFYDVMGIAWGPVGSLNAPNAARLGFLPSPAQQVISSSGAGGTFTLAPMGSRSGLRVLALEGGGVRYWVEYRAAVGQDAWLDPMGSSPVDPGVLVRVDGPGPRSDTSLLLDGTPSPVALWDSDEQSVLPVGGSMSLAGGDLVLTVTGATASGATVTVRTAAETPIAAKYRQLGGAGSRLGAAVTGEFCGLRNGGCWQGFQGGTIHWSPATGAQVSWGAVRDRWAALGWEGGRLGYPTTGENCGLRGGGCWQGFQGGTIHWSPATGAQVSWGAVRDRWAALGWEGGRLGYPTTGENCGLRNGGCWQGFQGGTIHWSPATGAQVSWGAVRDTWAAYGWEGGRLGYPTTGENCGLRDGGCWQGFQGGTIHWSPASGARVTWGATRDAWAAQGWENGRLGYPVSGEICGLRDGGCFQVFQGGSVYWSPRSGAWMVFGSVRDRWAAQGWEAGRLGYPVQNPACVTFGWSGELMCRQQFQGGVIDTSYR